MALSARWSLFGFAFCACQPSTEPRAAGAPAVVEPPAASVASAASPPAIVEAPVVPAAPANKQLPAGLSLPQHLSWMGATAKEATLRFSVLAMRDSRVVEDEDYYAHVDLETGCVTGTVGDLGAVWKAHHTAPPRAGEPHQADETVPDPALDAIKGEAFQKRWRELAAFLGPTLVDPTDVFTLGRDAQHATFRGADWLYVTADGGTSFRRLDTSASYLPRYSPQGDALVFSHYLRPKGGGHHYEMATTSANAAAPLVHVGPANPRAFFFAPDGASLVVASYRARDKKACVHRVSLATKKATEIVCAASHEQGMRLASSPGATFAVLRVQEVQAAPRGNSGPAAPPKPLDPIFHVIDLAGGKVVGSVTGVRAGEAVVDDRGQIAWSGYVDTEGGGAVTTSHLVATPGSNRDLGKGTVLGFAPGGRLVLSDDARLAGFGAPAAAGPNGGPNRDACGWVRIVATGVDRANAP